MFQSVQLAPTCAAAFALLALSSSGCMTFDLLGEPPGPSSTNSGASTGSAASVESGAGAGSGVSSSSGGSDYELVDNMEDGTLAVTLPHWQGTAPSGWTIVSDGSSGKLTSPMNGMPQEDLIELLPMVRGYSQRAVHLAGSGFTSYGADAVLAFNRWNVSAFTGFKFWARTDTPTCNYSVILQDINTVEEGGTCTKCYDGFVEQFKYTTDWKQYTVAFDTVHQGGWGMPQEKGLATKDLWIIIFRALQNCKFDMWIDDIELYH